MHNVLDRTEQESKPKVLIVTSAPSPYRIPLFEEIGKKTRLSVFVANPITPIHKWIATPNLHFKWATLYKLFFLFMRKDYAVIITNWQNPLVLLLSTIRWIFRRPISAFYESTDETHRFHKGIVAYIRAYIFKRLTSVICVGEASKRSLIRIGVEPAKIWICFNTVDSSKFRKPVLELRDSSNHEYHTTIFVGRLIELKNVDTLIQAWSSVRKTRDRLVIVGDGPKRRYLEDYVNILGCKEYVQFTGYLNHDELVKIYAVAQTLVLVSKKEVWGLVINEALICGLNVVVSSNCGAAESVKGMPGVYIVKNDLESISDGIRTSMAEWRGYVQDPPIMRFTIEMMAQVWLNAIQISI